MAFQVYPIPQTAPLTVTQGGSSGFIAITELAGVDATGLDLTMFIRLVKLGAGCAASGPPHPTIRLQADTGDAVVVPTFPLRAPIFNQPGQTGTQVAEATLAPLADDVYRVFVFVSQTGSSWQVEIVNNDPANAHEFTWVVADNDAQTRQPWIDVPAALTFDVLTGQAAARSLQVTNRGTGPLVIGDNAGFSPGTGFVLTTVPDALDPNACADLQITFTGPDTPATSAAVYTITSNDTTAQVTTGHNRRVNLSATTRKRAFRFDEAGSVYDGAFYNETPEQAEIRLACQEGQQAGGRAHGRSRRSQRLTH